ncbi:MAG: hypothetical protein HW387_289 [Parachlamydiales bacterium]|nr:hypothetical protein [Parachlamydiales bacterium]
MKRTPKNYDGILTPARSIKDLLPEMLVQIQKNNGETDRNILSAWPDVIGPNLAKMTQAVSFADGVLTVLVKSSTLYSLLCLHEKPHLLRKLQESFPKTQVRNILFRIG